MTGVRALVQRPRRKMHLASLDVELGAWATFCDLYVVADQQTTVERYDEVHGISQRLVDQLRRVMAGAAKPGVCAHCRRFAMLMQLLQHDRSHGVLAEYGRAA